jgi:poly[(R)-3-hydroxyalkanoate] polymerase subunit PhaC
MIGWNLAPFDVHDHDNPETLRFKKYATGAHIVLQGNGVSTGQTSKEVAWQKDKVKLYRYESATEKRYTVPVLLVYALILRPYILDLVPGHSFVEYLLDEGFDVFMLDWGVPGDEDKNLSFENYVLDYLPEAVEQVLQESRSEGLTLFGYCQGGTISAMYAALFPGAHPKNLVLLATPIDFAPDDPGFYGLWTLWSRQEYFDPDPLVETFGNVPADVVSRFIESLSRTSRFAVDSIGAHGGLWNRVTRDNFTDAFLAVSKWVDDGVPFPGEAFRRWIRDFYQGNKLIKGELELRGRRVCLSNIRCPLLNIAGRKDVVCPLPQAEPTTDLVGGQDKESLVVDAGHVGLMAGSVAENEVWPRIRNWLQPRS